MADELIEQREGVLRTIRRAVEAHEGMLGFVFPTQELSPGSGLAAPGGAAGPAETFATGYDGSLTTLPFMFDISLFDGGDFLT